MTYEQWIERVGRAQQNREAALERKDYAAAARWRRIAWLRAGERHEPRQPLTIEERYARYQEDGEKIRTLGPDEP